MLFFYRSFFTWFFIRGEMTYRLLENIQWLSKYGVLYFFLLFFGPRFAFFSSFHAFTLYSFSFSSPGFIAAFLFVRLHLFLGILIFDLIVFFFIFSSFGGHIVHLIGSIHFFLLWLKRVYTNTRSYNHQQRATYIIKSLYGKWRCQLRKWALCFWSERVSKHNVSARDTNTIISEQPYQDMHTLMKAAHYTFHFRSMLLSIRPFHLSMISSLREEKNACDVSPRHSHPNNVDLIMMFSIKFVRIFSTLI